MKMAKASKRDLDKLQEMMEIVTEYVESGWVLDDETEEPIATDDQEVMSLIRSKYEQGAKGYMRVIWGYQLMLGNCCDPDLSHLEFKPEIRLWEETHPVLVQALASLVQTLTAMGLNGPLIAEELLNARAALQAAQPQNATENFAHLKWYYDDCGQWNAASSLHDDGSAFMWRVDVLENGLFSIAESDSELTNREEPFVSLQTAKQFCHASECAHLAFGDPLDSESP